MKEITDLLNAVSTLAWPCITAAVIYMGRDKFSAAADTVIHKLKSSQEFEFGNIKIKGPTVSQSGEVLRSGQQFISASAATSKDEADRLAVYNEQRNLMLVHTIKPSKKPGPDANRTYFDASIYLLSHGGYGRINDVKSVTYYLGKKWGRGEFGTKFTVTNGNNGFAFSTSFYGPMLCVADILFHDGEHAIANRYIDVEMAPLYPTPAGN